MCNIIRVKSEFNKNCFNKFMLKTWQLNYAGFIARN